MERLAAPSKEPRAITYTNPSITSALPYLFSSPTAHEPTLSTASSASLGGSLVEILAFLWVGATGAWKTLCFREGRLTLTVAALGAAIILCVLKEDRRRRRKALQSASYVVH